MNRREIFVDRGGYNQNTLYEFSKNDLKKKTNFERWVFIRNR